MNEQPWTMYWFARFRTNKEYSGKRFKRLNVGYPPFNFDEDLIDAVEMDEFVKIEEDRLPLLIGSQFGIYPDINKIPNFFNGKKLFAMLGKSLLSGLVASLRIYLINENDTTFPGKTRITVFEFSNDPDLDSFLICDLVTNRIIKSTKKINQTISNELKERIRREMSELYLFESQVILRCTFYADSDINKIRIWPTTYLIDTDSDHKSRLLYSEQITIYPDWTEVKPETTVHFILIFSGLPESCTYFNLMEDIPEPGGFMVNDISRNRTDVYEVCI